MNVSEMSIVVESMVETINGLKEVSKGQELRITELERANISLTKKLAEDTKLAPPIKQTVAPKAAKKVEKKTI